VLVLAACDHVTTIPADVLGEQVGQLLDRQEAALSGAVRAAFDLD
jgi:mRNA interferase MazF